MVLARLLETELLLELGGRHLQSVGQNGEREVDGRRNGTLDNFSGLAHVNEILVLERWSIQGM